MLSSPAAHPVVLKVELDEAAHFVQRYTQQYNIYAFLVNMEVWENMSDVIAIEFWKIAKKKTGHKTPGKKR